MTPHFDTTLKVEWVEFTKYSPKPDIKPHENAPKRLQFKDALSSGNNNHWLTSARNPLETKGFRALYVLTKKASATLLQHVVWKVQKGIVVSGYEVKKGALHSV